MPGHHRDGSGDDGVDDEFAYVGYAEASAAAKLSAALDFDFVDVTADVTPVPVAGSAPGPVGRCGAPGCGNSASRWCGKCGAQRCRRCCTGKPSLRALVGKKEKKKLFALGADSSWCLPCASAETARLITQRIEQGPGSARVWTSIFASRQALIFKLRIIYAFFVSFAVNTRTRTSDWRMVGEHSSRARRTPMLLSGLRSTIPPIPFFLKRKYADIPPPPNAHCTYTPMDDCRRLVHRQHQSHGGRVLIFRQRLAKSFEEHRNPKRRGGTAGPASIGGAGAPPDKKRSVSSLMLGEDWSSVNLLSSSQAAAVTTCPAPNCGVVFGLLKRRHHCRLCGMVFCDAHVFRSIQLYIDEGGNAVVRLVAAGQQPMGAVLLRGCSACCDALERAMDLEARGGKPEPLPEPSRDDQALAKTCQELSAQRQQILTKLPAFRGAVMAMTDTEDAGSGGGGGGGGGPADSAAPTRQGSSSSTSSTSSATTAAAASSSSSSTSSSSKPSSSGGVQLVARSMADISTLLAEFNTGMQLLKRRQRQHLIAHPSSLPGGGRGSRQRVAESVAQSMLAFYRDHSVEFRGLTEDLEQAIPAEVLERIAKGHDVRAVTNVLVILQLCVTESMAFKGLAPIHRRLATHVCKIEDALEELVTNYGYCPWAEHKQLVHGLVRELAREKPQIRQCVVMSIFALQPAPAFQGQRTRARTHARTPNAKRQTPRHAHALPFPLYHQRPAFATPLPAFCPFPSLHLPVDCSRYARTFSFVLDVVCYQILWVSRLGNIGAGKAMSEH